MSEETGIDVTRCAEALPLPGKTLGGTREERERTWAWLDAHPDTLFVAADVSSKDWKLAGVGRSVTRPSERTIGAFDFAMFALWVATVRKRHHLKPGGPIVFCYEAGRDGFSIARALQMLGVFAVVVDPASIETNSRGRQAKTDKLDAKKLLTKLRSFVAGDRGVFAVVQVPDVEVEDARRVVRERGRLTHECTMHKTRISALLALVGVIIPLGRDFITILKQTRTPFDTPIPPHIKDEILRELERLELVEHQLAQLDEQLRQATAKPKTLADEQGARIKQLRSIGDVTATVLPVEFFWRGFKNRKEVGAAAGLTGTPFVTGSSMDQELGISKVGNRRVRTLMIEIAWGWVRLQPDSPITQWYNAHLDGTKRSKRKAIVAVARRLLIALWRYGVHGIVPEGARMKTA